MTDNNTTTRRPKSGKFKQQKLDAWQPILTPTWVIGTFFVVAAVFLVTGIVLVVQANSVFELVEIYDDGAGTSNCSIVELNEGYDSITAKNYSECTVSFTFTRDIEEDEVVYLYYQLEKVYQNHRLYVKSRSDEQLQNKISWTSDTSTLISELEADCDPSESLELEDSSLLAYPCGLIALSYFNDGIQLYRFERDQETFEWRNSIPIGPPANVTVDTSNIAWQSDLDKKFRNPTVDITNGVNTGNALQYETYEYLWQRYDQFHCYDQDTGDGPTECLTWDMYARKFQNYNGSATLPGNGCAACANATSVLVNEGGIREPKDFSDSQSSLGVRTESFIVWMRTAALPNFRKLYGRLNTPGGFKKDDKLTFRIIPNFLVSSFDGKKGLVLGTASPLGMKNFVLGTAYLVVGGLALVLGVGFLIKLKLNPRKLGDPKYLHTKQA